MSTRALIGRPLPSHVDGFEGNYHHFDGYPTGLGKTLWDVYHMVFDSDGEKMLHFLMDEHPAGWSSINNANWDGPIGFVGHRDDAPSWLRDPEAYEKWDAQFGPRCYCHGDRHEEPSNPPFQTDRDADDTWCEWAYIIDAKHQQMHVFTMIYDHPRRWQFVQTVDLQGEEPTWENIETLANKIAGYDDDEEE